MVSRAILSNWKTVNSKPPTITIGIVACTFSDNLSFSVSSKVSLSPGGGGLLPGILGGSVPPGSPNPDPISDWKMSLPHPFSDQTSKIHTRFQTCPLGRNYVIITYLEHKQKNIQIHFEFPYFSFFLTHLELERKIRSYTPVVPSKTIHDSGPKWAESIPLFRPKRRKNPTRWGGTYWYSLYKGVPPPPPPRSLSHYLRKDTVIIKGWKSQVEPEK